MYLECSGTGSPTVVLVSGQRSSAAEWHTTRSRATPPAPPVFEEVARSNRVCAYDRPGTVVGEGISRSDPVPQPTNAATGAADLQTLLAAAGVKGPFVLVGHSLGGMIVRLYATTYPDEVVGMVLVDATSEFLQDAETPDQWKIQRVLMRVDAADIPESVAEYPDIETFDIDATFAQLRAAPRLHPMPLVVLSADELLGPSFPAMIASGAVPADVPPDFGYVFDAAQAKAQARLAALAPNAVHLTHTRSGHDIHLVQPQLVVDAVLEVVALAKAGPLEAAEIAANPSLATPHWSARAMGSAIRQYRPVEPFRSLHAVNRHQRLVVGKALHRQRVQVQSLDRQLPLHLRRVVDAGADLCHQLPVVSLGGEITAAALDQLLLQPMLPVPVRALDGTVLVGYPAVLRVAMTPRWAQSSR